MEKITTYEQYSQALAAFKEGRAHCAANKMMTREEIAALIDAGKLYTEQVGDTLWFLSDEGYFYSSWFYVPRDRPIQMRPQDKDVVAELFGKGERYNDQWDRELVAAGFEKRDKRLEYGAELGEIIDDVRQQNKMMRAFWEKRGFTVHAAAKADYPAIEALWMDRIGRDRYSVTPLTEAQLEEMEQYGRCPILRDPEGKIVAASLYLKSGKTAYGYLLATVYQGSGLGAVALYEELERAYDEDCKKTLCWVREDNDESAGLVQHAQKPTGKFFWQFVCHAEETQR